jgi:FemAB-related protein (PEP-CTERM system-associated)
MQVTEYSSGHESDWQSYVENHTCATVAHLIEWREIIACGLGHKPYYLMAMDGSVLKGVLPMFIVKTWWGTRYAVSLPWIDYGGICADDSPTARALLERASEIITEQKAEALELRSIDDDNLELPLRRDKVTFLLELNADPDVLWKKFDAKLRNQIRKADKAELTTELGGVNLLPDFYAVFSRNMRDLGTPVWGKNFFEAILTGLDNRARIAVVRRNQQAIAAGLVILSKDRIYVPSASSYRWTRKMCPNHALYWHLIKKGCEEGYRYFDFGRSTWDSTTFRFKKQWVPQPTQLHWQYVLNKASEVPRVNPDNPKYRLFINMWRHLPLPLANFLGPKVIKNFP